MSLIFTNAKYIKSAVLPKDYPHLHMPEVAVAGRSNVGKSSLLNNLFHTKGLVKTSSTPGKTQTLNFFTLHDSIAFCDLPGYGFANVPLERKKQWGPMIQTYLETRETLKLVLLLIDIRRVPNREDKQLLDWIAHKGLNAILVITKSDKANQKEKSANTKRIIEEFNAENLHYVHYSTLKHTGRNTLIAMIKEAIR